MSLAGLQSFPSYDDKTKEPEEDIRIVEDAPLGTTTIPIRACGIYIPYGGEEDFGAMPDPPGVSGIIVMMAMMKLG